MPYIGRSTEAFGVRSRFTYLASASDTSVSGPDVNGLTLSFTDGAYVDVFLNGVRLKHGTDYVTTTANTIGSLSALAANDEVEIVVFDVFSLADMVSSANGGNFSSQVNFNTDSAVVAFGADNDITLTHSADTGLILKNTSTTGNSGVGAVLTLQTGDTDIAVNNILGSIQFQAPDEGTGTDAILVAGKMEVLSEGNFSSSNNATSMRFLTGNSAAAGTDGGSMILGSTGNLTLKDLRTADGSSPTLTLQSGDTDIAQDDVLGTINFQAPDEGTGTDAILVAAGISAISEGDFSSSSNATKLVFKTGSSEAASEKMSLSSAGLLTIADDLMIKDGGTIGVASTNDAITISSAGIVTFKDDIIIKDAGTIGSASDTDAISIGSDGDVTLTQDLELQHDGAILSFGANDEIQLIHDHNVGLLLKHANTADNSFPRFTLQTGDNDISQDDVLGQIQWQAPDEGAGTDAILVAAKIDAISEGDFSSSNNATSLRFLTGSSAEAVEHMRLNSAGQLMLNSTTAPTSDALMIISGTESTDQSPFIEFKNTSAGNDDTLGGFLCLQSADSVAEVTARRESATDDAFLFFGTQKTGGSLTERFRILSGGNQVGKNGFFKASNASNQYYNGTDPSSGNWHEFNSGIGNEQILAITNHNTGTDNEGFVVRHVANTNNTSSGFISCANDVNGTKFAVKGNGNVQSATDSYGSTSDERLKSNIVDANSQWDDIKQLKFRNFKKYNTEDLVHLGLVAQEAEKISPNLIYTAKPTALDIKHDASFGTLYEDGDTIPDGKKVGDVKEIKEQVKYIKSSVLYMKAVKALQEAVARIETLETSNADLISRVKTLEDA